MINRRGLLLGLLAAPAVIRTPGLLMPVRPMRGAEMLAVHSVIEAYIAEKWGAAAPVTVTFTPTGSLWAEGQTITVGDRVGRFTRSSITWTSRLA